MFKKSVISPFAAWKNFLRPPTTVRYPKEDIDTLPRPGASPSYRGQHINDHERCIGCGTCEEICPAVFKLNDETGKAEVINPKGASEDQIQEAVDACPVECIHWEE